MKYITVIILLMLSLSTNSSSHMCPDETRVSVFPRSNTISSNSLIIIEGGIIARKMINELSFLRPIYLELGKMKVDLEMIEKYENQGGKTMVIFRPKNQLIAGATYELVVENLSSKEQEFFKRIDSDHANKTPIYWTVKRKTDKSLPEWIKKPQLVNTIWKAYLPGSAAYAIFDYELSDYSQTFIKTEVQDLKTNQSIVYYLKRHKNDTQFNVGTELCNWNFKFEKNRNYKVRFDLMDICGNTSGAWTDWVEFESPENKAVW